MLKIWWKKLYNTVNPILLRKESHFTKLIVLRAHENVFYSGLESTLANVHLNYWIIKGWRFVKKELKQCYVCKLIQGEFLLPPKTPLPSFWVNCCYPFETTGLDFAGTLHSNAGKDNELQKCYILLFTCATVHAVHLQITRDFSSKSLVLAIRRFITQHRKPALFVSDNFKSFKCANVKEFIFKHRIKWEFIIERSPW